MSDRREIVGLWASASGPVIWVRPGRGRSVLASLAPARGEPAIDLIRTGRDRTSVVGTWDGYYGALRIPLPWLRYGAELTLDHEYGWTDEEGRSHEERLTGGVSMDDVPGARPEAIPRWLLPTEPYLRVPKACWSGFAILSSALLKRPSAETRRGSRGPQNNEMHLTRSAPVRNRGPRR